MTPTITDDDKGTITATVDGKVVRSWQYDLVSVINDQRAVMAKAREYAEGWHNCEVWLNDLVKSLSSRRNDQKVTPNTHKGQTMPTLTPHQQMLNVEIDRLQREMPIEDWNTFIEEIEVPSDLAAVLSTGRPELVAILQPRDMTADEVAKLYKAIAVLIRTNMALQDHTRQVARLVDNWMDQFAGVRGVAQQIDNFANFRKFGESEGE